jgi:hypothetical protein
MVIIITLLSVETYASSWFDGCNVSLKTAYRTKELCGTMLPIYGRPLEAPLCWVSNLQLRLLTVLIGMVSRPESRDVDLASVGSEI